MSEERKQGEGLADEVHSEESVRELYALGERLAEFAQEQSIPLEPDHAVTGRLAQVVPANEIPEEVYGAVAALLGFLRDSEESMDG